MAGKRSIIEILTSAEEQCVPAYTQEVQQAIYEAVHFGDNELKGKTRMLIYEGIQGYTVQVPHSDEHPYVTVAKHISGWNPEKGSLQTFFRMCGLRFRTGGTLKDGLLAGAGKRSTATISTAQ